MKTIKVIKTEPSVIEYIQSLFEDYMAKKDLLTMIFELHKNDEDGSIIDSIPFVNYEKKFMKAKLAYDTAMKEIQEKYIPEEYKMAKYTFEINFENFTIDIKE